MNSAGACQTFSMNGDPAPGMVTCQDEFAVSYSEQEQITKIEQLLQSKTEKDARKLYRLCSQSQWNYDDAKKALADGEWRQQLTPLLYRLFDLRWTVFNSHVAVHRRERATQHMVVGNDNICLISTKAIEISRGFEHVFASRHIIQHHTVSIKEVNYLFPLYLYPSKTQLAMDTDAQLWGFGEGKRRANLAPAFVAQLGTQLGLSWQSDGRGDGVAAFGPEDVLAYIYAIFHAPSYRARYAEFLKTDFPRVPLTDDAALFWALVEVGHQLLAIHTLSI